MERLAKALTIFSFVLMCWVAHRTLQVRESCVSSSFVAYVVFDDAKVSNCAFESRLTWTTDVGRVRNQLLRRLETLEPLLALFPRAQPKMTVQITDQEPDAFALGERGSVRIGVHWLDQPLQVRRALTMAVLKNELAVPAGHLDVMTDFIILALFDDAPNVLRGTKFPTAPVGLDSYCKSPLRSLAHAQACALKPEATKDDSFGLRPLLASALWRTFTKATVAEQVAVLRRLRTRPTLPAIEARDLAGVENLVDWFRNTINDYALGLELPRGFAFESALKELEVEAPTHWELTIDLTRAPAWKEIVEQLKTLSRFRARERALLFTPEGEIALPSGLPVAWSADDVQSQKHVLIACEWPKPGEAVHVRARQMFARQACGKLDTAFWY